MSVAEGIGVEKKIVLASSIFVVAVTALIALSVKMFGIGVPTCLTDVRPFRESKVIQHAPDRYEVHYVAKMWSFEPAELAIRPGSTVDLYLSTADVTHGMQIVGTNVNLMAVPGTVNYVRVKFDKPGEYLVVCNEYCGISHHNMAGKIRVSEEAVAQAAAAELAKAGAARGQQLLDQNGCLACHSLDGSETLGPTFKGLFGKKRVMTDGSVVVADSAYLRQSVVKPDARVVKGFDAMPPLDVPDADLRVMIAYLESLR